MLVSSSANFPSLYLISRSCKASQRRLHGHACPLSGGESQSRRYARHYSGPEEMLSAVQPRRNSSVESSSDEPKGWNTFANGHSSRRVLAPTPVLNAEGCRSNVECSRQHTAGKVVGSVLTFSLSCNNNSLMQVRYDSEVSMRSWIPGRDGPISLKYFAWTNDFQGSRTYRKIAVLLIVRTSTSLSPSLSSSDILPPILILIAPWLELQSLW